MSRNRKRASGGRRRIIKLKWKNRTIVERNMEMIGLLMIQLERSGNIQAMSTLFIQHMFWKENALYTTEEQMVTANAFSHMMGNLTCCCR